MKSDFPNRDATPEQPAHDRREAPPAVSRDRLAELIGQILARAWLRRESDIPDSNPHSTPSHFGPSRKDYGE